MEKVLNEVRVKDEPICYSQSISTETIRNNQANKRRSNDKQSIKQEKRTREDISVENEPNKRKRQSIKVKEEPTSKSDIVKVEEKFLNKTSIAFLTEETTNDNQA